MRATASCIQQRRRKKISNRFVSVVHQLTNVVIFLMELCKIICYQIFEARNVILWILADHIELSTSSSSIVSELLVSVQYVRRFPTRVDSQNALSDSGVNVAAYIGHNGLFVREKLLFLLEIGILPPTFPFGNFADSFLQRKSIPENVKDAYNSSSATILGAYMGLRPVAVIRDPKAIQNMLVKESISFSHRGISTNEDIDSMVASLFLQNGDRWHEMRRLLSPAFTTGRLKEMFGTIVKCAD